MRDQGAVRCRSSCLRYATCIMLIGATTLGRFQRPRLWAFRKIKAGRFGPVVRHHGALCVEIAHVETAMGVAFTAEQIAAAVVLVALSGEGASTVNNRRKRCPLDSELAR
jgi:ribulose-5-phosphate 4-epimerase/fuculose-1-phosphate aldolase